MQKCGCLLLRETGQNVKRKQSHKYHFPLGFDQKNLLGSLTLNQSIHLFLAFQLNNETIASY